MQARCKVGQPFGAGVTTYPHCDLLSRTGSISARGKRSCGNVARVRTNGTLYTRIWTVVAAAVSGREAFLLSSVVRDSPFVLFRVYREMCCVYYVLPLVASRRLVVTSHLLYSREASCIQSRVVLTSAVSNPRAINIHICGCI